jgi:hypothetical protein
MKVANNQDAQIAHSYLKSNSAPKPLEIPRWKNEQKILGMSNQSTFSVNRVNPANSTSSNGAQSSTTVTISDEARQALAKQS